MEEDQQVLIKKNIRLNKIRIVSNIILLIVFLLIGYYIYSEIDNFKTLSSDVCRLCEQKTGGKCLIGYGVTQSCPVCNCDSVVNISKFNELIVATNN